MVSINISGGDFLNKKFKTYIINLNYNKRMLEHDFIKDTLSRYDEQTLTGSMLYVDNYSRKMKWGVSFDGENHDFLSWLKQQNREIDKTYQKKLEESQTYFLQRGWNATSLNEPNDVDRFITEMPNGFFLYGSTK